MAKPQAAKPAAEKQAPATPEVAPKGMMSLSVDVPTESISEPTPEPAEAEAEPEQIQAEEAPAAEETPAAEEPQPVPQGNPELEQQLYQQSQALQHVNSLLQEPEIRKAVLRSLHSRGQLTAELQAELETLQQPQQQVQQAPSKEQIRTEVKKLMALGREDEAIELAAQLALMPRISGLEQRLEQQLRQQQQAQINATKQAQFQAASLKAHGEMLRLAEKYPDLVEKTQDGRAFIKDETFRQHMMKLSKNISIDAPLEDIAEHALLKMGRLALPSRQVAKPVTKPSTAATAARPAGLPETKKPQKGEVGVRVMVEQ